MKSFKLNGYKFKFISRKDWGSSVDYSFIPENKIYIIIEMSNDKIRTAGGVKLVPQYYAYDELQEISFTIDHYGAYHEFVSSDRYFHYPFHTLGPIRKNVIKYITDNFDEIKKKTDYLNLL